MSNVTVSLAEIHKKTSAALSAHGASDWIAEEVANAVRKAEANGNLICGLYYLESYCQQLVTGRVNGTVDPIITTPKTASVKVDAGFGFAQAAFAKGLPKALEVVNDAGTCSLAVCHSHTCTSLGYFTEQIAEAGYIGIGLTNASAVVSPPGGTEPVLGTNPIAMAIPEKDGGVRFQFDQSTSAIALGKITMAAAAGEDIPLGWAIDSDGNPTTDPKAALKGSLVSTGGYKGYGFGLMAEVLAAAVTGGVNSVHSSALKAPEGKPHNLGQFYFLLNPEVYSGNEFWQRLDTLADAVESQPDARLPGSQRKEISEVTIESAVWDKTLGLAEYKAS